MASIGMNMKRIRKTFMLSQADIGRMLGVGQVHVSYMENNKRSVYASYLKQLSTRLNVPVEEFYR